MARQMVFLIDLPLKNDATTKGPTGDLTSFGEELCFFLRAQGMGDKMINSLHKYDFSETACYGFVHTIGGSHTEPDLWQRTGYGDFLQGRRLPRESVMGG